MSGAGADFLAVAIGGAFGASLRHGVNLVILSSTKIGLPAMSATLIVNVAGCAVMGAGAAWVATRAEPTLPARFDTWLMIRVGILGSLTTFSTFIAEILASGREHPAAAAGWLLAHVLLGAAAMLAAGALVTTRLSP